MLCRLLEALPEFFCHKRHDRVQEPERCLQHRGQDALGDASLARVGDMLGHFDVPIAKIVPEKLIEGVGGVAQQELVQGGCDPLNGVLES